MSAAKPLVLQHYLLEQEDIILDLHRHSLNTLFCMYRVRCKRICIKVPGIGWYRYRTVVKNVTQSNIWVQFPLLQQCGILFCICIIQYLEIRCKLFCTLLNSYTRVCLSYVYLSLTQDSLATGGNVVKPLFPLYQTQYLDILCKLFWTMECACRATQ